MTREPLPRRRYSESFDFAHLGIRYSGQVGFYDDGRLGEVFLGMEKAAGTAMDVTARDAAVLISIGLQHGIDLEHMVHSVTRDEYGQPEGLIGSLLAFLARYNPKVDGWGSPRVIEIAEKVAVSAPAPAHPLAVGPGINSENARDFGYTGDQCVDCQSFTMVRNGVCLKCTSCGATTSCS